MFTSQQLHPSKQLELMQRYCGGEAEGMHSRDPHLFKLRAVRLLSSSLLPLQLSEHADDR